MCKKICKYSEYVHLYAFPYQSWAWNFPQFQNPSAPVETLRVLIKREDCCNWEPSLLLYSSWTKTTITADANNSRSDSKISLGGAGGAAKMGGKELQTKTLQVASSSHIVRQNPLPKASGLLGNFNLWRLDLNSCLSLLESKQKRNKYINYSSHKGFRSHWINFEL